MKINFQYYSSANKFITYLKKCSHRESKNAPVSPHSDNRYITGVIDYQSFQLSDVG